MKYLHNTKLKREDVSLLEACRGSVTPERMYYYLCQIVDRVAMYLKNPVNIDYAGTLLKEAVAFFSGADDATIEGTINESNRLMLKGILLTYEGLEETNRTQLDDDTVIKLIRDADAALKRGEEAKARKVFSRTAAQALLSKNTSPFIPDYLPEDTSTTMTCWASGLALLLNAYRQARTEDGT